MTDDDIPPPLPPFPTTSLPPPRGGSPSPAPGNRVPPRLIVAIAVAVLMALGIGGLIAAAVLGDDGEPTGDGLRPSVNVDEPATAPAVDASGGSGLPDDAANDGASGTDTAAAATAGPAATAAGGDDFSGESPTTATSLPAMTTAVAVADIEAADEDDLPPPGSEPVELPALVTTPAPPSTYAAIGLGEFGPGAMPALDGWTVAERSDDHLSMTDGDQVVEIFLSGGADSADDAMANFYDEVRPELEEMAPSPITRLGSPSSRFESVAGSEYVATTAGQQGTSVMTGAIVAGVRTDGSSVVITSSRAGRSSAEQLAADGDLLRAILARL